MSANQDGNSMAESVEHGVEELSAYERDIAGQGQALSEFIALPRAERVAAKPLRAYERVIVTGMGSSHFAGARTWRRLVAAGVPAWWVDTAALLDSPALVTAGSLLIVTSQSGASGEIVALFERVPREDDGPEVIGITNDTDSALAQAATRLIPLCSGAEATVSTKSYVNSLAAHEYLTCSLLAGDWTQLRRSLDEGVAVLDSADTFDLDLFADAAETGARIVLIGGGDHLATALFGGLILKEAAKVAAEGFFAGNFRHGPLELAGPGLVAFVLGVALGPEDEPLRRLASDIAESGAAVATFGPANVPGCEPVASPAFDGFPGLVAGAQLCHAACVSIAQRRGLVPGEFHFGQKVTGL
jgi:glutamine---fructose-6-phosphate transaminase (isomerizing)